MLERRTWRIGLTGGPEGTRTLIDSGKNRDRMPFTDTGPWCTRSLDNPGVNFSVAIRTYHIALFYLSKDFLVRRPVLQQGADRLLLLVGILVMKIQTT